MTAGTGDWRLVDVTSQMLIPKMGAGLQPAHLAHLQYTTSCRFIYDQYCEKTISVDPACSCKPGRNKGFVDK